MSPLASRRRYGFGVGVASVDCGVRQPLFCVDFHRLCLGRRRHGCRFQRGFGAIGAERSAKLTLRPVGHLRGGGLLGRFDDLPAIGTANALDRHVTAWWSKSGERARPLNTPAANGNVTDGA